MFLASARLGRAPPTPSGGCGRTPQFPQRGFRVHLAAGFIIGIVLFCHMSFSCSWLLFVFLFLDVSSCIYPLCCCCLLCCINHNYVLACTVEKTGRKGWNRFNIIGSGQGIDGWITRRGGGNGIIFFGLHRIDLR
ncbi:uncharacterized protein B0H64DRAFT_393453 [Chaetomium fimeti]|uniref:Uncharacterized protein n=1 Tax=Chaetomium fimeti TaxID=1854472 RepID=A0AAE0LUG7_9PEZI|nr:hypothetical protein B0H64DRAFT_393453 [Chaetomium fimeti]